MSWRIISRPQAETDIARAAEWYDRQQPGLGGDWVVEAQATYDAISKNPYLNAQKHRSQPVRWRRTHRFPYRVIYQIFEEEKCVVVWAVMHSSRHDSKWQRRVS